nr:MAG TPA: hypothetical protein [Caudoviricetes sp.]
MTASAFPPLAFIIIYISPPYIIITFIVIATLGVV